MRFFLNKTKKETMILIGLFLLLLTSIIMYTFAKDFAYAKEESLNYAITEEEKLRNDNESAGRVAQRKIDVTLAKSSDDTALVEDARLREDFLKVQQALFNAGQGTNDTLYTPEAKDVLDESKISEQYVVDLYLEDNDIAKGKAYFISTEAKVFDYTYTDEVLETVTNPQEITINEVSVESEEE